MKCRLLVVLWWMAGCYSPDIATGVPCGPQHECPGGQTCDLGTGLCEVMVGPDGGVDAAIDAAICDATERLVSGACVIPLDTPVTPSPISAAACRTGDSTTSRSVALDAGNRIYVVYRCGTTNDGFVVTSSDGGATVSAPQALGTGLTGLAVQGGARKVAYAATTGPAGTTFAVTTDGGATWSQTVLDVTAPDPVWGVSIAAAGDAVYVAARIGTDIRVWRNAARGAGSFASVDVVISNVFGEVLADPQTQDVWVVADNPNLHLRKSQDGGATFAAVIDPPTAMYFYSDWSLAGSSIFVTGSDPTTFATLATAAPTVVTPAGATLPAATSMGRMISARADGAVYIANQDTAGALTFLRFDAGASTGVTRAAGPGTGPSIVAGPGTAAPAVFTHTASTTVQLGMYVF